MTGRDCEGETAMHKACLRGHAETVKVLLLFEAVPTAATLLLTNAGKSQMEYALEAGHNEVS